MASRIRIAWVTDPHFDQVPAANWRGWVQRCSEQSIDGLVLTGDLSEGDDVATQLKRLAENLNCPVYFVMGNHDFYDAQIGEARRMAVDLARQIQNLHYLTDCSAISLNSSVALLGDDGWGDATLGDFENSPIRLRDFDRIRDFDTRDQAGWRQILQEQGRQSAQRLRDKAKRLPDGVRTVVIATHVPPFREACWYEGQTTDDAWAPFFVCGQLGEALLEMANASPQRRWIVLCGHTHHDGVAKIQENLIVHTGYSGEGECNIESILEIDGVSVRVPRTPTTGNFENDHECPTNGN